MGHMVGVGSKVNFFLILFLFYIGYIALWSAVEDPDSAADLTSILCIVGSVFAVLSRYATVFWNQGLHQDASLSVDKEEHVADVFTTLISCHGRLCFTFYCFGFAQTRSEIMTRRASALLARRKV